MESTQTEFYYIVLSSQYHFITLRFRTNLLEQKGYSKYEIETKIYVYQ